MSESQACYDFRGLTIRFVSIRLEVLHRIAPTKAKFFKTNLQGKWIRHHRRILTSRISSYGPSVVGAALCRNTIRLRVRSFCTPILLI